MADRLARKASSSKTKASNGIVSTATTEKDKETNNGEIAADAKPTNGKEQTVTSEKAISASGVTETQGDDTRDKINGQGSKGDLNGNVEAQDQAVIKVLYVASHKRHIFPRVFGRMRQLFKDDRSRRALVCASTAMISQQLCGINTIGIAFFSSPKSNNV